MQPPPASLGGSSIESRYGVKHDDDDDDKDLEAAPLTMDGITALYGQPVPNDDGWRPKQLLTRSTSLLARMRANWKMWLVRFLVVAVGITLLVVLGLYEGSKPEPLDAAETSAASAAPAPT